MLRPYQIHAFNGICRELRSHRSTLCVLPTGTGKSHIYAACAKAATKRVMVLAHRHELIMQGSAHIKRATGEKPDIEMGDDWATQDNGFTLKAKVVVSSIQTQCSGKRGARRMTRFNPHEFSLLIADEGHHAVSASWLETINYYKQNPDLKVIGFTATPDRADELALGKVFETVAYKYELNAAIADGWLCPIRQTSVFVKSLDFSKCRTTAGDLNGKDLAAVMEFEETLHGIATPTLEICKNRKTLIFGASCLQAERLCEILNRHRPNCAKYLDGETHSQIRADTLKDYSLGKFQFLVNVGIATEGFDEPTIEVVVMARPTKSRGLFAQMVGRGTRPLPGLVDGVPEAADRCNSINGSAKPYCEILDFVGNAGKHSLISVADILGGDYSDAARAKVKAKHDAGEEKNVDVRAELDAAEIEVKADAEKKQREWLTAKASFSLSTTDPFDVLNIVPQVHPNWRERVKKPSGKQLEALRKFGLDVSKITSMTKASQLLGELIRRKREGVRIPSFK